MFKKIFIILPLFLIGLYFTIPTSFQITQNSSAERHISLVKRTSFEGDIVYQKTITNASEIGQFINLLNKIPLRHSLDAYGDDDDSQLYITIKEGDQQLYKIVLVGNHHIRLSRGTEASKPFVISEEDSSMLHKMLIKNE
jgi:hypothetical protein